MPHELSEQSQNIMTLAQNEAREMNHDFVGTEHILLALLIERPGALSVLGVSADAIRQEIEKVVVRGTTKPSVQQIPLTPRSQHVIDIAHLQAFAVGHTRIEPEHLLIGLMHEPDGVAHRVMRNLGLDLQQVEAESLKIGLEQKRIVERAVRPLRAATARKRKMREELLAHLNKIFEEELALRNDPAAALGEAAKRFGDSAQLSRELQGALTSKDRREYWFERGFGWRPPETAAHMMLRVSFLFLCVMACTIVMPLVIEMIVIWERDDQRAPVALRTLMAMLFFLPLGQFLIGICYFKTRDSLFGVFGSRKSLRNSILLASLASLSLLLCGASSIALQNQSFVVVREFAPQLIAISIFTGFVCMICARVHGPIEIRDTLWATMDLQTNS